MKEPAVLGTTCPHCGNDCTSQDAIAAQERIQELEAQVRLFTEKASETGMLFFPPNLPRQRKPDG